MYKRKFTSKFYKNPPLIRVGQDELEEIISLLNRYTPKERSLDTFNSEEVRTSFDFISRKMILDGSLRPLKEEDISMKMRNRVYCASIRRTFNSLVFTGYDYDESVVIKIYSEFIYWTQKIQEDSIYRDFYIHVSKFFLTVYVYSVIHLTQFDSLNINYISMLFQSILGPETAEISKVLRAKLLRDEISESKIPSIFYERKILKEFPMRNFEAEMDSYDSYLSEDFLIHWECETDKFEHCLTNHECELNSTLYRQSLKQILGKCIITSENQFKVSFSEVAGRTSNSKMIFFNEKDWKKSSRRLCLKHEIDQILSGSFLKKSHKYMRSIAQVSPANGRDIWIADVFTYAANYYYDTIVRRFTKYNKHNCISSDKILEMNLERMKKKSKGTYMCLDVKSSQLDFSHDCLKIICEELTEATKVDFINLYNRVKNQTVLKDGMEYIPRRGTGLGMMNHIYNLHMMTTLNPISEDFITFNDDSVVHYTDEIEDIISPRFYKGLEIHLQTFHTTNQIEKLILSKVFVFLEEVYNLDKHSYVYSHEKVQREVLPFISYLYGRPDHYTSGRKTIIENERIIAFKGIISSIYKTCVRPMLDITVDIECLLPSQISIFRNWNTEPRNSIDMILVELEELYDLYPKVACLIVENYSLFFEKTFGDKFHIESTIKIKDSIPLYYKTKLGKTNFDSKIGLSLTYSKFTESDRGNLFRSSQFLKRFNILNYKLSHLDRVRKIDFLDLINKIMINEMEPNFAVPKRYLKYDISDFIEFKEGGTFLPSLQIESHNDLWWIYLKKQGYIDDPDELIPDGDIAIRNLITMGKDFHVNNKYPIVEWDRLNKDCLKKLSSWHRVPEYAFMEICHRINGFPHNLRLYQRCNVPDFDTRDEVYFIFKKHTKVKKIPLIQCKERFNNLFIYEFEMIRNILSSWDYLDALRLRILEKKLKLIFQSFEDPEDKNLQVLEIFNTYNEERIEIGFLKDLSDEEWYEYTHIAIDIEEEEDFDPFEQRVDDIDYPSDESADDIFAEIEESSYEYEDDY